MDRSEVYVARTSKQKVKWSKKEFSDDAFALAYAVTMDRNPYVECVVLVFDKTGHYDQRPSNKDFLKNMEF